MKIITSQLKINVSENIKKTTMKPICLILVDMTTTEDVVQLKYYLLKIYCSSSDSHKLHVNIVNVFIYIEYRFDIKYK